MERQYLAFCATNNITITNGVLKIPKTKRFIQYIPTSQTELTLLLGNFDKFYTQSIAINHTFGLDRTNRLVFAKSTVANVLHLELDDESYRWPSYDEGREPAYIDTNYDRILDDLYAFLRETEFSTPIRNMYKDTISMIHYINQEHPLVIFELVDDKGNNNIPKEGKDYFL